MIDASTLRRLAALDLPTTAFQEVLSIVADMQAADEARREGQRNRKRKSRDSHGTVTGQERDQDVTVTAESRDEVRDLSLPPVSPVPPSSSPPDPPSNNPLTPSEPPSHTQAASDFEKFWKEFPERDGANPRAPAAQKFAEALKAGSSGEEIVAGARAYRTACDAGNLTGSRFVVQACRWLEERRWVDCEPRPPPAAEEPTAEQLELRRKLIEEGERLLNGNAGKAYLA